MKTQTIKANINGKVFEFENDAYNRLDSYLNSMRRNLNLTAEELEDTLGDMEARIAELLTDKLNEGIVVIQLEHIIRIISIIGEAEQIEDEAEPETKTDEDYTYSYQTNEPPTSHRRLYRLNEHRILGGVCSGIADYLNIDSVWIRLLFIAALFLLHGVSFIVYLVLWAIIPNENSVKKKSAFGYEQVKSNVKNEYHRTRESFHRYRRNRGYSQARSVRRDPASRSNHGFSNVLKIAVVIVAVLLFFKGLMWITGSHAFHWNVPHVNLPNMHGWFHNFPRPWNANWSLFDTGFLGFMLFLLIFIPVLLLVVFIIKSIFSASRRGGVFSAIFFTIWIFVLIAFIMTIASGNGFINIHSKTFENTSIASLENRTLLIMMEEEELNNIDYFSIFNYTFMVDNDHERIYQQPEIRIRSTDDQEIKVKIEKQFVAFEDHDEHKVQLFRDFSWRLEDSILVIDQFYEYEMEDWWQQPRMIIYIYLPENQEMKLDENITKLLKQS